MRIFIVIKLILCLAILPSFADDSPQLDTHGNRVSFRTSKIRVPAANQTSSNV